MILGMSVSAFTILHVIISLIGIATGLYVMIGMAGGRKLPFWTAIFLLFTVATSVTGFFFKSTQIGPPHIIGAISLVILAIALYALYGARLKGSWRWIYVVTALIALFFNVFVGVIQAFQKLSFLQPLVPTQSEPPFLATQIVVLIIFLICGWLAVRRYPV
ncbi:MAG: hypothetical protein LJE67_02230 [Salaquimonas sp.]|jgi:hypothetical protein|nr:hypothetical protein [Salaquimonas sp.]